MKKPCQSSKVSNKTKVWYEFFAWSRGSNLEVSLFCCFSKGTYVGELLDFICYKISNFWSCNQWQKLWDLPPLPLIQCCLPIDSSFLVFTASHDFFKLDTTLTQGEGGFWVNLSKSNVFLWTVFWKYSDSQLLNCLWLIVD